MAQLDKIQLFKESNITANATDGTRFYAPIIRGFKKEIPNPSGTTTYLTIDLEQNTTSNVAKYHAVIVEGKIIDDGLTASGYISNVIGRHFKHTASTIFNPDGTESVIGEFDTLQYNSDMNTDLTTTEANDTFGVVDILNLSTPGTNVTLSNGVLNFNLNINSNTVNALIMGIYYLI